MRFALAVLTLGSGCRGLLGIDEASVVDGGVPGDTPADLAMVDAPGDVPANCYGQDPYIVCPPMAGGQPGTISGTIDTSTDASCDFIDSTNTRDWCVVVRNEINIVSGIRVIGDRPLVLLARQDLVVILAGMIDAASHFGAAGSGPGANPPGCMSANGQMGGAAGQGSGGAGGSFKSIGGNGGAGHGMTVAGGVAQPVLAGSALRGGCTGGNGGGTGAPSGGRGGGAIYLVAGGAITIDGTVNASGAGGTGGVIQGSGGGGGGSGGMIVLSAPRVDVTFNAQVFANGGGGGSGGGTSANGGAGSDAPSPLVGAAGSTVGTGGSGGRGAFATTRAVNGNDDDAGGGGGGGGIGYLRVLSPSATVAGGTVSPLPN